MKMPPDDAYALRQALEPETRKALATNEYAGDENALVLASIAVSLKRIADKLCETGGALGR